jgi:V/A-type H+-transporting ATPase subunit E
MLIRMADAYMAHEGKERRVELLLSPEDQTELVKFYTGRYRQKMGEGLVIRSDNNIIKGFKVSFVDDHAQHDFTGEAIAEALAHFLRPNLAQIILRATGEESKKA